VLLCEGNRADGREKVQFGQAQPFKLDRTFQRASFGREWGRARVANSILGKSCLSITRFSLAAFEMTGLEGGEGVQARHHAPLR
jgi:hypothetical protein